MSRVGFVSLVGAGPGSVDHLTLKAARQLQQADLVLYDALVSDEVRALAVHAECVFVGKRAGRKQTPQSHIEQMLIAAARVGRRVVRLKGGDPFVFGRGGEEALALSRAAIPFEIVPGVSASISAPALAGIPVTHRGVSSGFVVLSGSEEASFKHAIRTLQPGLFTLIVLMGTGRRSAIVQSLLAHGWARRTPSALIVGVATPQMWAWRGDLDALAGVAIPSKSLDAPGTIVIGAVAALPLDLLEGVSAIEQAVPA